MPECRPLRVAVTVELLRDAGAGGQVKCWERFAEAACAFEGELDLTVFFLGATPTVDTLSDNVRIETLPPVLSTDDVPLMPKVAPVTDIAQFHRALARRLEEFDVIHATHAFAFAQTARRLALRRPLVTSIHADLPYFARAYLRDILTKRFGPLIGGRILIDGLKVAEVCARDMHRRVARMIGASDWVLISHEDDLGGYDDAARGKPVSRLRRGINHSRFNPGRRDRVWLAGRFGIPVDRPIVLFAGRVDDSKNVMVLAEAAARLLGQGVELHLVAAGKGTRRHEIHEMLGSDVTLLGMLDQDTLARVYASADIFAFPSESEIMPNAVLEARDSGLPVVLSAHDNGANYVREPGTDGILVDETTPDAWARALWPLLSDPGRRSAMGSAARRHVAENWPQWTDVLREDLLAVWQRVAASRTGAIPPEPARGQNLDAFRSAADG